jgi:hypothetical protein
MHPLLMLSAGVVIWAATRQIPQARALAAAVRAAAREFQEQNRKPTPQRRGDQQPTSQTPEPK